MPTDRRLSVPRLMLAPLPRVMLAPLGVREMPVPERLMVGLVRLSASLRPGVVRPLGSERSTPGVRLMLGPVRPLGEGVSLVAESPAPGCRVLGMLAPRSAVEPEGVRVMDGMPVRDPSGLVSPPEGVRLMLLRLVSAGERVIEGLRPGEVKRESPDEGRLICPSGRAMEGLPVERLTEGASRNLSSEPRSNVRFWGETRSVVDGRWMGVDRCTDGVERWRVGGDDLRFELPEGVLCGTE